MIIEVISNFDIGISTKGRILKVILLAILVSISSMLPANELVLAQNGKTEYQIVTAATTSKDIWNAEFLAWFLKEKTGAVFPVCTPEKMINTKPVICVGDSLILRRIAGTDPFKDMKQQDHIAKSVGRNILLYGKGFDADFYAITEFLDRCLQFRIYQRYVVPEIARIPNLTLQPFDYKIAWALPFRFLPQAQFSDYFRGDTQNRNEPRSDRYTGPRKFSFNIWPVEIEPQQQQINRSHTAFLYLPTAGSHYKGYPFIENRNYFQTNPEFYALDKNGRRNREYPCFATAPMRLEMIRNIEKHFAAIGTDNVQIGVNYPDGVDVCHCPVCTRLAEKYHTPGGAYFEFIKELGEEFLKTHPRTMIHISFYQQTQTQIPPDFGAGQKFPPNIKPMYCNISAYSNRTWDAPENKQYYEWLKKAAGLTNYLTVMTYYPHYGQIAFLPFAADNVIVDNLRKIAALGLEGNFLEFYPYNSGYNYDFMNFSDLNLYLYYRFSKDPSLDYDQEVECFMTQVYGPAAKLTKTYHDELVRLSTVDNPYGIILSAKNIKKELAYLCPENLHKWQRMFDEMTGLVADSQPQIRKNVANLRRSLDIATYGSWPALQKRYAEYFNDPAAMRKRIGEPAHLGFGKTAADYLLQAEIAIRYMGKEKTLPEQFRGTPAEKIKRVLPRNTANYPKMSQVPKLVDDDDAAFGYAVSVDLPDLPFRVAFTVRTPVKKTGPSLQIPSSAIDSPGQYRLYHLGEIHASNEVCLIWFSGRSGCTNYFLSEYPDIAKAGAIYDTWVSLKFPAGYSGKDNDLVLCDQIIFIEQ